MVLEQCDVKIENPINRLINDKQRVLRKPNQAEKGIRLVEIPCHYFQSQF